MKKIILFTLTMSLISYSIFKSNNTLQIEKNEAILDNYFPSEQGKEVYRTVGKMPKYPGEEVKLFKYLE